MGADFKSEFDDFVFEKTNTISRRMISKAKDIKVSHRLFMDAMVENTGNSKVGGVRDWYTSFTKDEQGARNPILSAQEENIFFDRNTRFKYLNWPILFTVLVASSITIWCHMEVSDVFPMLFVTFASLSAKLIDIFRSLHKAQKLNEEAKNMIDKGEDILEIQKNLDRIRRINTLSLSLHYNLKRIKLHQQYKDY